MKKTAIILALVMICSLILFPIGTQAAGSLDPYIGFSMGQFDESTNKSANPGNKLAGSGANQTYTYKNVDFGETPPYSVTMGMLGGQEYKDKVIKLYIDKPSGNPIAQFTVSMKGWTTVVPCTTDILVDVTGVHTLYMISANATMDFYDIRFLRPITGDEVYREYNAENNAFLDIVDSRYKREINMLSDLGLVSSDDDNFYPDYPVTRGGFTKAIYKMTQGQPVGNSGTTFADVPEKSEHFESVSYAVSMGYISGYGDGLFRPDRFISVNEAVKIMSRVLGYDLYAEQQGGFESGYLIIAHNSGLLDGITNMSYLTNMTMAKMIYNAINCDFYESTAISRYGVEYSVNKNGILSKSKGIYRTTGTITANNITTLSSPATIYKENVVCVDDTDYNAGETMARVLLGYECEIFYKLEGEERTIAALAPIKGTTVTEINSHDYDITYVGTDAVKYLDKDGNEEKIELDNSYIIYNGVAADKPLIELRESGTFRGKIKYVENKCDIDVLFIDEYINIEIGEIDLANKSIFDNISQTNKDYPEGECFVFFEKDGKAVSIVDVPINSVAMVYESKNITGKKMARYIISDKVVKGKVEQMQSENGIVISGEKYTYAKEAEGEILVGTEGSFKINAFGEVVALTEEENAEKKVGWLIKQGVKDPDALTKSVHIKVLDESNTIVEYKLAEKGYVDGALYENNSAVLYDDMCNNIIAFILNNNGEVKELDTIKTVAGGKKDCLTCRVSSFTWYDWHGTARTLMLGSGVSEFALSKDAKILSQPSGITDPKDFTWVTSDKLGAANKHKVYSYDTTSLYADILIWDNEEGARTNAFAFKALEEGIDTNGNAREKLLLVSSTQTIEYFISDDDEADLKIAREFKKGDLINGTVFGDEIKGLGVVRLISGEKTLSYDGGEVTALMYDGGEDEEGKPYYGIDSYGGISPKTAERFVLAKVIGRDGNYIETERVETGQKEIAYLGSTKGVEYSGSGANAVLKNNISKSGVNVGDTLIFTFKATDPISFYIVP